MLRVQAATSGNAERRSPMHRNASPTPLMLGVNRWARYLVGQARGPRATPTIHVVNRPNQPRRQHTVSQALLREFTDDGRLVKYDIRHGKAYRRSPRAVGYHADFISVAPQAFEDLWKVMEDQLPAAIATLATPEWPNAQPAIDIIKLAVVVHFVRNKALRHWELRNIPAALQVVRDEIWLERKDLVRAEYERRTGRAGSPEAEVRSWLETIGPGDELLSGAGFAQRVLDMLNWTTRWIAPLTIQVLVAGGSVPFILSDAPVVPFRDDLGLAGYGLVALGDAQGVLLPLSPSRAVCVANNARTGILDDTFVTRLNFHQLNSAIDYVIFHPRRDMAPWLSRAAPFRR